MQRFAKSSVHRSFAFSFESPLGLADMVVKLNEAGPWLQRENDRLDDYLSAPPIRSPHRGIARILKQLLTDGAECHDAELAADMYLAAMGHDLYEDTEVTRDEIRTRFGARVDALIFGMTNRGGYTDRAAYEREMGHALEEVRLIKLSDLIDNVLSCAYGIHDLGSQWITATFVPIAEGMSKIVKAASYSRFARTAARAVDLLDFAMSTLRSNLANFRALEAVAAGDHRARAREALKNLGTELAIDPAIEQRDDEQLRREGWLTKGMHAFDHNKG